VFPWLVGSEERLRWMGALVDSEPLDVGPPVRGSRFRDVFEELGRRVELEAELVEREPPRLLAVHLVSDVFEATSTSRLEPLDGGTRLAAAIETTYTSLAARLLAPAVTRHAQKQLEADLDRLKDLVEAEPG
jgi:Polyketide cyclase / dehydrase and lipid transport